MDIENLLNSYPDLNPDELRELLAAVKSSGRVGQITFVDDPHTPEGQAAMEYCQQSPLAAVELPDLATGRSESPGANPSGRPGPNPGQKESPDAPGSSRQHRGISHPEALCARPAARTQGVGRDVF